MLFSRGPSRPTIWIVLAESTRERFSAICCDCGEIGRGDVEPIGGFIPTLGESGRPATGSAAHTRVATAAGIEDGMAEGATRWTADMGTVDMGTADTGTADTGTADMGTAIGMAVELRIAPIAGCGV